jgi:hypothetical protein
LDIQQARVRGCAHRHQYAWICGCDSAYPWADLRRNGPGSPGCPLQRNGRNWLSDAPLGLGWKGVTTNNDGRVTKLSLKYNDLSGEIPAELGSLSNLESLDLSGNALSGEIPAELGSLSNLTDLYLKDTDLSGCVPGSLEDQLVVNASDLPFC